MTSEQSKLKLNEQLVKLRTSKTKKRISKMTEFIDWWHTKVNGPYLTNEQFQNIYNKF